LEDDIRSEILNLMSSVRTTVTDAIWAARALRFFAIHEGGHLVYGLSRELEPVAIHAQFDAELGVFEGGIDWAGGLIGDTEILGLFGSGAAACKLLQAQLSSPFNHPSIILSLCRSDLTEAGKQLERPVGDEEFLEVGVRHATGALNDQLAALCVAAELIHRSDGNPEIGELVDATRAALVEQA
jgi:hypothetical protein